MNTKFDLERAVKEGCKTRDGRAVRILCTDAKGCNYPVKGLITGRRSDDSPIERGESWTLEGRCFANCDEGSTSDLVNLPKVRRVTFTRYAVLRRAGFLQGFSDESQARNLAHGFRRKTYLETKVVVEVDEDSDEIVQVLSTEAIIKNL